MEYRLVPYELLFKTPFQTSHGIRKGTPALFLFLSHQGKTGFGEASFPPYLSEKAEQSKTMLEKVLPLLQENDLQSPETVQTFTANFSLSPFTRNILVNALLDLCARLQNISLRPLFEGSIAATQTPSTFTITKQDNLNDPDKINTAGLFSMLKLKLDGNNDLDFVQNVIKKFNCSFCVDVNQGWEKLATGEAKELTQALKDLGCVLLEQPFAKTNHEKHLWLKTLDILPVYADEGVQNKEELLLHGHCYDGVNIKLLKCGGLDRAYEMAVAAKEMRKKTIAGCMSESSCGCSAALALKGLVDYFDLDGPWLIGNDPFNGMEINKGELRVKGNAGTGVAQRFEV